MQELSQLNTLPEKTTDIDRKLRYLQTTTDIYRKLQISIENYRYLQKTKDIYRKLQISIENYRYLQITMEVMHQSDYKTDSILKRHNDLGFIYL